MEFIGRKYVDISENTGFLADDKCTLTKNDHILNKVLPLAISLKIFINR